MKVTRLSSIVMVVVVICCVVWSFSAFAVKYDPVVEQVQQKLTELGYEPGPVDGKMGKKTAAAITSFQKDNGLSQTGKIDDATLQKLGLKPAEKQAAPAEPEAPAEPTPAKDPPKINCSFFSCTVENSLPDEMVAEIKKHFSENDSAEEVVLKNCSDADLKQVPALNDIILRLTLERSEDLSDLTPLRKMTKLQRLTLAYLDSVTDLTPLEDLQSLVYLSMREFGAPVNLDPVAKLTNLEELRLGDDLHYPSFDFLEPLENLKKASFYKSKAQPDDPADISALAGKPNLQSLKIAGSNVSDLSPVKDSPELTSLELEDSPISDLTPLQAFPKLSFLKLIEVPVTDLSPLEGLTELRHLTLYDTDVTDLTPLIALKDSLKHLNLNKTPATDLTPVGELSELTDIYLDETNFTDYSPLAKCTKLEFIQARTEKSGFSDLSVIKSMPNLKRLWVDGNDKIQDWDALKTATSLESLSVGKTSFSDLKLLENLTNLEDINFYECSVKNPETLVKLPNLTRISFWDVEGLDDITIFKDHPKLPDLYLGYRSGQIPQEQIDALEKAKEEARQKQQ